MSARRRRRITWPRVLIAAVVLAPSALLLPLACHGYKVPAEFAPNHGVDFDFRSPPCEPAGRPDGGDDKVLVRYLGVSGLWIEWRGTRIVTAPYFSNPGPLRAGFGAAGWNDEAVRRGLAGHDLTELDVVLSGHSHYDHLADIPPVLGDLAPRARLYVNRSGANILAGFSQLAGRITVLEDHAGDWLQLEASDGRRLPVRILPVESGHANHFGPYHYAPGEVTTAWESWEGRKYRDMREGQPFTFLIDLLDPDGKVGFRIFYQDASAPPPLGLPPGGLVDERPVDLAVFCMPGHWQADGYPEENVKRLQARHRIAMHYEDFFRPADEPLRFVATLGNGRARRFLQQLGCAGGPEPAEGAEGPDTCGCGPCGPRCSMPLPGEWLRFSVFYESFR